LYVDDVAGRAALRLLRVVAGASDGAVEGAALPLPFGLVTGWAGDVESGTALAFLLAFVVNASTAIG
jgi:hypothetical protein